MVEETELAYDVSFCRTCTAGCGTKLTIDDQDRIIGSRGDENNAMSRGYACFKGLHSHIAPNACSIP